LMFNREVAIKRIGSGRCACAACSGQLTDPARSKGGWGFCRVCRCAWQVSAPDWGGRKYTAMVPSATHRPPPSPPRVPAADDRHQ
jgi:hypothetical protein